MKRKTLETDITVEYAPEKIQIDTGDRVLDHMLKAMFFYMGVSVRIEAKSDLLHHLWEDTGIAIGSFLAGEHPRDRINRFGNTIMPMDEALILISVDISRCFVNLDLSITAPETGFSEGLFSEFVRGLSRNLKACIHIIQLEGENAHHIIEARFKGLGKALGEALGEKEMLQSTKGRL